MAQFIRGQYLRDLFGVLRTARYRLLELAPLNWARTVQRDEVQKLLNDNRFTLDAR
ncbi:MAG: hypothetical protein KIT84_11005 [Labilithrix sp.]|nr:hypothetical protein [Labilithrix sp.]MCW5811536.1 hypothetical protein [Labilithrix sp.]